MTSPTLKTALLAALAAMLLFVPPGITFLLRDPGQVSEKAVAKAKAELGRYALLHPEEEIRTLAVVDFSKPSFMKRMLLIDLHSGRRWPCRVAHGRRSGELLARSFSNVPESNMSSLGLFRVGRTYSGEHGMALRLDGLDSLCNGNAAPRDIVVHSADYVSIPYILWNLATFNGPRIGRSNGCFVVSRGDILPVASLLGRGGFIYAWDSSGPP
ncbi:MAG: murein L,D-transpeptidase catalytic domain family protein [Chlorobiaceae bacterium]|nr:murein L,D-transpeptidase catalytic domain family protein [Chlorobiaceae bacterium]